MFHIKWLFLILACCFMTGLNGQATIFDTGVKYYESIKWINYHIKESKDIHFLEFSPNSFMSYYDINGKKLGEITYRLDYINPNDKNLTREDLLNKNTHKFVVNDTIILGYIKKRSRNEIVLNSSPVQVSHDETESFTTSLVKLRKTTLDIKKCSKKRIFKSSKWTACETDKPLIITKQNSDKKDQTYLKAIDGCIFLIHKKQHQDNITEFTKRRLAYLGKYMLILEFLLNDSSGLFKYYRN